MGNPRTIVLAVAMALGALYLFVDHPAAVPYPADVVIKTGGVALLGVYALLSGAPVLALALGFSAIGDAALALQPAQMIVGIAAFGVAHLVYLAIVVQRLRAGRPRTAGWPAAAAVVAAGFGMLIWLRPHMGDLQTPATIYNLIIIAMVAAACLAPGPVLVPMGAILFFLSDGVLATRMFMGAPEWTGTVVWILYFSGQLYLAVGIARGVTPARS